MIDFEIPIEIEVSPSRYAHGFVPVENIMAGAYSQEFARGYTFLSNSAAETARKEIKLMQEKGFDTITHDRAFDVNGKPVEGALAILVKLSLNQTVAQASKALMEAYRESTKVKS